MKRIGKSDDKLGPTVSRKRARELLGGIRAQTMRMWERKGKIVGYRLSGTLIVYKLADIEALMAGAASGVETLPQPAAAAAGAEAKRQAKHSHGNRRRELPHAEAA